MLSWLKKKTAGQKPDQAKKPEQDGFLDDVTYIKEIKQTQSGPWHQYDVLLASRGYGWEYMLSSADYMAKADLEGISEVQTGDLGLTAVDVTEAFTKGGCRCAAVPELKAERGMLSVAGMSKALRATAKLIWFNQTRVLRLFTVLDDAALVEKYFETVIRRTFGTKDAMKRGKPIPSK